jgi:Cu-Zn family superoxide dismutase
MLSSQEALAELKSPDGRVVGKARLINRRAGVVVRLNVAGLPPGRHGAHIHAAADCRPPDFVSAGDHFDHSAEGHDHGEHSGDLPNLEVGQDGRGSLDAMIPGVTLTGTDLHSLFREGGTSLVIHEHADDGSPAASGGAGVRIACGEIRAAP